MKKDTRSESRQGTAPCLYPWIGECSSNFKEEEKSMHHNLSPMVCTVNLCHVTMCPFIGKYSSLSKINLPRTPMIVKIEAATAAKTVVGRE